MKMPPPYYRLIHKPILSSVTLAGMFAATTIGKALDSGWLSALSLALLIAFLVTAITEIRHANRSLCGSECPVYIPADPEAVVRENQRALSVAHRPVGSTVILVVGAVILSNVIAALSTPAGIVSGTMLAAGMIWWNRADHTHTVLQPWCPYCRGGGGGDEDDTDVPTPDPAGEKEFIR